MQITLLPICLPRSENYGLFYWLMSYPLRGPAVDEHYDVEKRSVDLTTGTTSNQSWSTQQAIKSCFKHTADFCRRHLHITLAIVDTAGLIHWIKIRLASLLRMRAEHRK